MRWIAVILFLNPVTLFACLPHEIYVRTHYVNAYNRTDGTKVKEYQRSGHCRDFPRTNFFSDNSTPQFKNISPKLKKWKVSEKELVIKHMSTLPPWLAKYAIKEMLRADSDGTINPASSIPFTKTILIYDTFFQSNVYRSIIIHEMSHLALWDLVPTDVEEFARLSGWVLKNNMGSSIKRTPPQRPLLQDSTESISEDFANHVEIYYSTPERLKTHNRESFEFIEKLIKQKEKP